MEQEKNDQGQNDQFDMNNPWNKNKHEGSLIAGIILIALGLIFLADRFLPRIDFGDLWPVLLLVVGIGMIISGRNRTNK